ncbi:MAG: hypothetical protein Q4G25_06555 [Paracoccus sp. (in: a-proteobacteria)]|nr:hypothetical protein [Paracoccus sp. (in: a-proteobacteria)]
MANIQFRKKNIMDMSMNLFTKATPKSRPVNIETMEDVKQYIEVEGPSYLLQSLRTLRSHTMDQPLTTIPADPEWIEHHFPKVKRGVHPRPDLDQKVEPYKKWRADLLRAVAMATGAKATKAALRAREDSWASLIEGAMLHTSNGGIIHKASASLVIRMADIARRAEVEPWELAEPDVVARLETGFASKVDRDSLRRAFRFLQNWRFLPEIGAHLPEADLAEVPRLRDLTALPAHIDKAILDLAETAASSRDEVAEEDSRQVSDSTLAVYLAALRYHVRTLSDALDEPDKGFRNSFRDLDQVNDVLQLFSIENISAAIRHSQSREDEPGALSQVSVASYYSTILVVLSRNQIDVAALVKAIKSSRYIQEGRELDQGMRPETQKWCEALLANPEREQRFRNLHRILKAKADTILDQAAAERRPLTALELTRARSLGTAAAASAIEWAGRPIRLGSVLSLRLRGAGANFFLPSKHKPDFRFVLKAEDTKAKKEEPETILRRELHGHDVMSWYLAKIRPLFPHAERNIFLFPAVETGGKPLCRGVFDTWFQRAATEAGLPMTFHRWRHGYATLLLDADFTNLQVAADMLGNTTAVCARNYAWINKTKLFQQGQDILIARSRGKK